LISPTLPDRRDSDVTQPPGSGPGQDGEPPTPYGRPPTYGPPGRHAQGYQPPPPPPGYYAPGSGYYGPPPGAYPPPSYYPPYYYAPRPGCVPLRPLGLGDILDGAFKVIRRNPRVTLGLSAMVAVVEAVISAVSLYASLRTLRHIHLGDADPSGGISFDPSQLVTTVVGFLAGGVLTGMLTLVVTQDVLGRRLSLGETWSQVRPRIWTLLGLTLLTTLVPLVGLVFCIAPGVWLWGIWAVAVPACMVERIGVRAALGRSKRLVDGTFWRVWGIRALGYLITSAVSWLIMAPFLIGGVVLEVRNVDDTGSTVAAVVLISVASLIARTFVAPVQAGIDALLYVDLRMRKEGLDIALQQAVLAPPAGPVAAD
jgi:hypothetical protein